MEFKIFNHEFFEDSVKYKILCTNEPYNSEANNWSLAKFVEKYLFFSLDNYIFECIFNEILSKFSFYDCYEISNFYDDELIKLCALLKDEININLYLSEDEFIKKYKLIFSEIKEELPHIKEQISYIKHDINLILTYIHQKVKSTIFEHKCIVILGI